MKCIWCLRDHDEPSVEHIIPEALQCPPDLILSSGEVCKACNSRVSSLDRVLADAFDMMRIVFGVTGKKGKAPTISGKGNLRGRMMQYGGDFVLNMGGGVVEDHKYGRIHAPRGRSSDVQAQLTRVGNQANIKMRFSISSDLKFSNALHKIAFEFLALAGGSDLACERRFDCIRDFVLRSVGVRRVLTVQPPSFRLANGEPDVFRNEDDSYWVCFLIFGIPYLVDLSTDQHLLMQWCDEFERERGDTGWTVIPNSKQLQSQGLKP